MAKRKAKRSKGGRRRRVGALGGDMNVLLGAVGGALVARFAASKLTSISPKIQAGAQAVAGYLMSKQSNPMLKGVGYGLFVSGALAGAQQFGLIAGVGSMGGDRPLVFSTAGNQLNGYNEVPQISGAFNPGGDELGNPELALISGMYDDYS